MATILTTLLSINWPNFDAFKRENFSRHAIEGEHRPAIPLKYAAGAALGYGGGRVDDRGCSSVYGTWPISPR